MKLLLRPRLSSPALAHRLAAEPSLAKALGAEPNGAVGFLFKRFFDAQGPLLAQVLAHAAAEGERMSFLWDVQFSAAEAAAASHLQVVCRKTVAQSASERSATLNDYRADALHPTGSRWQVRLPRRVFLSKTVPPATIAQVDQYTGEFVLGAAAAQALAAADFRGWQLQPVLHWKTLLPQPELGMHLTTQGLLPAALEGPTRFETFDNGPGQPSTPRRYGALSYAPQSLAATPDFGRTAEPWGAWSTPQWIVRQRVRAWVERNQLVGWNFWPVLEEGTALQREHQTRWHDVLAQLRSAGAEVLA